MFAAYAVAATLQLASPDMELRYESPAPTWDEGLPLGNGLLGALVWGDGQPLRISLNRTDLWDLRPVPEYQGGDDYKYSRLVEWVKAGRLADIQRLYDRPYEIYAGPTKIPAGRIEIPIPGVFKQTALDMASGIATYEGGGAKVEVLVHPSRPVGMIRITGLPTVVPKVVAPKFGGTPRKATPGGMWELELAHLGYPPPTVVSEPMWAGYRQTGWGGFRFGVALVWKSTEKGWEGAWSIASARGTERATFIDTALGRSSDPLNNAKVAAENALDAGFAQAEAETRRWWRDVWNRANVKVPNERLQELWVQETYKFAAATRRNTPPITLQGPWTADTEGIPPWKGDYHHDLNTQLSYWPAYSGNRLDHAQGFVDWLWRTKPNAERWTKLFFEKPGLNVPMTADLNNNQIGGWHPYTHSATTGAWLAHHFYLQWRYSMDRNFLKNRAYPWLRDTAIFLESMLVDGVLPLSSSPEIHDNSLKAYFKGNTNYDLALMRWTFEKTAELALELGERTQSNRWLAALKALPDLALGQEGRLLVATGEPLPGSHRHFSHLMAIHPLGIVSTEGGAAQRRIVDSSLRELREKGTDWWTGYSFAWLANLKARVGDGEGAEQGLMDFTKFVLRNSFHANGQQTGTGLSKFTYRPFTLEGNFAAAAGLQEMLIQSHDGVLRIFPAVPADWKDVSFTRLRAEGAFVVSAERKDGKVQRIEILSEQGGELKLRLPEGIPAPAGAQKRGGATVVVTLPGQRLILTPKA